MHEKRDYLIKLTIFLENFLKNYNLTNYNNQALDLDINKIIQKYTFGYNALLTTGEGDCLYCAISLNILGSELLMLSIKLGALFMLFMLSIENFLSFI